MTGTPTWEAREHTLLAFAENRDEKVWRIFGPSMPRTTPTCKILLTDEREAKVMAAAPTNEAIVAMFYKAILNGQSVGPIMDLARQSLTKTRKELPGIDQASERSRFIRRAIDIAKAHPDMTPVQAALEAERQLSHESKTADDEGPEVNT